MPDRVADNWELDGCSTQRDPKAGPRREQTMAELHSVSRPVSGTDKTLSFETGKLAGLADGAVVAVMGGTEVLATATATRKPREGADFFPLTVDVEERMYAAGKIPGSFFRREGRPTEKAILSCRLIDRPLRPSFRDGYRCETHIVATVLSVDDEHPYDVVALNAASAALHGQPDPLPRPHRRRAHGLTPTGAWIPMATYPQLEKAVFSRWSWPASARRRRHRHRHGRGRGHRERPGGSSPRQAPPVDEAIGRPGLEEAKAHIARLIDLQLELRAAVGEIPRRRVPRHPRLHRRAARQGDRGRRPAVSPRWCDRPQAGAPGRRGRRP